MVDRKQGEKGGAQRRHILQPWPWAHIFQPDLLPEVSVVPHNPAAF